jgi:MFS family permease
MLSKRYTYYALMLIFVANFFNYLDRQIVSAVLTELKTDLSLDDIQAGWIGSAFTLGYLLAAPFIGMLADRKKRTTLFSVCIIIWSFATIGSGMAQNFSQLFVTRLFIGLGEAGCLAIGPSLIADYFTPETRGRALAVFFLGLPLGGAAGYVVGGAIAHATSWRNAFYAAGLPGILIGITALFLKEPPRGEADSTHTHAINLKDFSGYKTLLRNGVYLCIVIAQAFASFALVPLIHFGVDFFQEGKGWEKTEATTMFGTVALLAGISGNLLCGWLGDRLTKKHRGAFAAIASVGFLLGLPFVWMGLFLESRTAAIPSLFAALFCLVPCMPAVNAQSAHLELAGHALS